MDNTKPTFFELLKQSLRDVEGGYDLLAPKFDHSQYITPETILIPFFKRLQDEKGVFDSGLDICCGTGAASVHLVGLCRKQFTALDLSQGMLDQCRKKIESLNTGLSTTFVKANALNMPFENEFDVAVSFGAFGHIRSKDENRFIQQIYKVLKSGGHFFFITTEGLPWWSKSLWRSRIFNFLIGIRNLLIRPKFIMYYLTFQLPKVKAQLEEAGFKVEVLDLNFDTADKKVADITAINHYRMIKAIKE